MAISEKVKKAFETTDIYEEIIQELELAGVTDVPADPTPDGVISSIRWLASRLRSLQGAISTADRHFRHAIQQHFDAKSAQFKVLDDQLSEALRRLAEAGETIDNLRQFADGQLLHIQLLLKNEKALKKQLSKGKKRNGK
jgi:hypothetical protein